MARKRYLDEDVLKIFREIEVHLHHGLDVVSSCRKSEISDKTITTGAKSLTIRGAHSFPRGALFLKRTSG